MNFKFIISVIFVLKAKYKRNKKAVLFYFKKKKCFSTNVIITTSTYKKNNYCIVKCIFFTCMKELPKLIMLKCKENHTIHIYTLQFALNLLFFMFFFLIATFYLIYIFFDVHLLSKYIM